MRGYQVAWEYGDGTGLGSHTYGLPMSWEEADRLASRKNSDPSGPENGRYVVIDAETSNVVDVDPARA